MATQMIGIRLDTKLVERIDKVAEAQETTRTAVIERAINLGLNDDEQLVEMLDGSSVQNFVERAVLSGLIKSNFIEVLAKLVGEDVDPDRKKMIAGRLAGRKMPNGKLAQG